MLLHCYKSWYWYQEWFI